MAVNTATVAFRVLDIVAGVPIAVPFPMYDTDECIVYYGKASLVAVANVDYSVTLHPEEFDTFEVIPSAALIAKINALIAGDPTEVNAITIRSELDYLTSSTSSAVRYTPFTSREFDRTVRRFAQIAEALDRSLKFGGSFVGNAQILIPEEGTVLGWDGENLVNLPADEFIGTITPAFILAKLEEALPTLPIAPPVEPNKLWNNGGVLCIS